MRAVGQCVMSRRQQRELCVAEALSLVALCTGEVAGSGPRSARYLAATCNQQAPTLPKSVKPEQHPHHNSLLPLPSPRPPPHSLALHAGMTEQYARVHMHMHGNKLSEWQMVHGKQIVLWNYHHLFKSKRKENKSKCQGSCRANTHTHIYIGYALGSQTDVWSV